MTYECKIYDKNGKLKKEITPEEIKKNIDAEFIDQKSTKLARKRISSFKEKKEIRYLICVCSRSNRYSARRDQPSPLGCSNHHSLRAVYTFCKAYRTRVRRDRCLGLIFFMRTFF